MQYKRHIVNTIVKQLKQDLPVFQVIIGPRQVGKTTAAQQIMQDINLPHIYASADSPLPLGPEWIESQWRYAMKKSEQENQAVLLVLDEIQKVEAWTEMIKILWDQEKFNKRIKLLILGSSALLLQKGLTESLAGRFFIHNAFHWTYPECRDAFDWTLNEWLFFGGYPGAAIFRQEESNWKSYVRDSLIETVLSKDVFQMQTVTKPTLLRHLFSLAATYPAQIFSYNKMLGQLQDVGNTTTLAHYLDLLETAFLVSGLEIFSQGSIRKRGSSPKLILWNNALINALSLKTFEQAQDDHSWWGRIVENAVGAHFIQHLPSIEWSVSYWREKSLEVDFVLSNGNNVFAVEVKSAIAQSTQGLSAFRKKYPKSKQIIIGPDGIPLQEFFSRPPLDWL